LKIKYTIFVITHAQTSVYVYFKTEFILTVTNMLIYKKNIRKDITLIIKRKQNIYLEIN